MRITLALAAALLASTGTLAGTYAQDYPDYYDEESKSWYPSQKDPFRGKVYPIAAGHSVGEVSDCSLDDRGAKISSVGLAAGKKDADLKTAWDYYNGNNRVLQVVEEYRGKPTMKVYFFLNQKACYAALRNGLRAEINTPSAWHVANRNNRACVDIGSPADKIRSLQDAGIKTEVKDLSGGNVQVGHYEGGTFNYWTFYKTREACMAALPAGQPVPSRYE